MFPRVHDVYQALSLGPHFRPTPSSRHRRGSVLEFVAEELRGDLEIALTAVSEDGEALEHVSEELKGNRDVVMTAVAQNWLAHRHATEKLRADEEIIHAVLGALSSYDRHTVRGLKATLLSGRSCSYIFPTHWRLARVLRISV